MAEDGSPTAGQDVVERADVNGAGKHSAQRTRQVRDGLTAEVDGGSLAIIRIVLGAILVWAAWRAIDTGHVDEMFADPSYTFRWWLFEWVQPLPGVWLYVAFVVIGSAAALVAVGLMYRVAAVVLAAGVGYWFLLEKIDYLNHMYLSVLLTSLLVVVPAHASLSIDAVRKRRPSRTVPTWAVWLLRFQVGVPYFFAGIAKMTFDWMVRAQPLGAWLEQRTDFPLIGPYLDNHAVARGLAWSSMAFDLTIVFFLLNRRTRTIAYGVALGFHFMNSRLFGIGIFPWIMIAVTTVFFEPDWPKRMAAALRSRPRIRLVVAVAFVLGFVVGAFLPHTFVLVRATIGGFGVAVFAFHLFEGRQNREESQPPPGASRQHLARPVAAFLAAWVFVQLVVPLRHWIIPGNVAWTGEGQRFSWQMLLNEKRSIIGIRITDPSTGETWSHDYSQNLTTLQVRRFATIDLIHQFAHHLDAFYREQGYGDVEVRARARLSLNGRRMQWWIDRRVDLSEVPRPYIPPADWIVPLRPFR